MQANKGLLATFCLFGSFDDPRNQTTASAAHRRIVDTWRGPVPVDVKRAHRWSGQQHLETGGAVAPPGHEKRICRCGTRAGARVAAEAGRANRQNIAEIQRTIASAWSDLQRIGRKT